MAVQQARQTTAAARTAHDELQSGMLAKASSSVARVGVNGMKLSEEAASILRRIEAVEDHYLEKENCISRTVGQLQTEEHKHAQEKEHIQAQLKYKRSALEDEKSSLRDAQDSLDKAKRDQEAANSGKNSAITASVVTGVAGVAASIFTFGLALPVAAYATTKLAMDAADYAKQEERAERAIQDSRDRIRNKEDEIRRCSDQISRYERQICELQQKVKHLQEENSRYHEERGEIRHLIVFVKNAQLYWKEFAEAAKHGTNRAETLAELNRKAEKRKFFTFFCRGGGKKQAMSFMEAWEEVKKMADVASEHLFLMDFECSSCGLKFNYLPYASDSKELVCSSCHQ